MMFSKFLPKRFLGVDIGTAAIKVVELSRWGERIKLENYGEILAGVLYEKSFRTFEKSTLSLSSKNIAKAILAVTESAKIKTKECIFSIPDFSTFFTNFDLPPMTKDELPEAVRYEARQHVPLPLGEVTLDWQVIDNSHKRVTAEEKNKKLKILLVAVPNEVIAQYQEIAKMCELNLVSLEAEVFGLLNSLISKEETKVVGLMDIGAQSTTYSIIDKGVLKISHSFDLAGNELTEQVAKSLSVDYTAAENLKRKYGLMPSSQNIKDIISPLMDSILREIERISRNFFQSENKEVGKFIIAGGAALIPGIREYFQAHLDKETEIANPFLNIYCPPLLEKRLKEMGPSYAIAVGLAQRGLE
ncbi:MAG: type IV pilus assembly protein PilM [bacterium]|nr:type IV pilus assembly protein PilM [bacterium]